MTLAQVATAAAKAQPASLRAYAIGGGSAPKAYRIQLGSDPAKLILSALQQHAAQMADRTQLTYGPVVLCPAGHVLSLSTASSSNLANALAVVAAHPTTNFDPKATYASNVSMIAVELALLGGLTLTTFREYRRARAFGSSRRVALLYRDGRFDQLDPTDLLLFDLTFDVLHTQGTAYFDKKRTFERMFDYLAPLKTAAKKTFKSVTANLKIKGLAEMELACTTDVNMMAKMASIARSINADPTYAKAMTMANLLKFIDTYKQYGVKTAGFGAARQLLFENTPQERYKVLKLLDDDYLRSQLTLRAYDSGSKIIAP